MRWARARLRRAAELDDPVGYHIRMTQLVCRVLHQLGDDGRLHRSLRDFCTKPVLIVREPFIREGLVQKGQNLLDIAPTISLPFVPMIVPFPASGAGSLRSRLDAIFLRHGSQAFHLFQVQPQTRRHAMAVIRIGLEEQGRLAKLDPLLRTAKVGNDVADQVIAVRVAHDAAVQRAGLEEVVVRELLRMARRMAIQVEGRRGNG